MKDFEAGLSCAVYAVYNVLGKHEADIIAKELGYFDSRSIAEEAGDSIFLEFLNKREIQ